MRAVREATEQEIEAGSVEQPVFTVMNTVPGGASWPRPMAKAVLSFAPTAMSNGSTPTTRQRALFSICPSTEPTAP